MSKRADITLEQALEANASLRRHTRKLEKQIGDYRQRAFGEDLLRAELAAATERAEQAERDREQLLRITKLDDEAAKLELEKLLDQVDTFRIENHDLRESVEQLEQRVFDLRMSTRGEAGRYRTLVSAVQRVADCGTPKQAKWARNALRSHR